MKNHILITGATGLVGKLTVNQLKAQGFQVSTLTREPKKANGIDVFYWNIEELTIDEACLKGVDSILHLAGVSIAEKSWTENQKKRIIDSRVRSTELLQRALETIPHNVKHFISASAVGYYGNTGDLLLDEQMPPGKDFLAECCIKWETAAGKIKTENVSVSILRFGIVLHKEKGSLPTMSKPIQYGLGAALGNGQQWVSWIHHKDLVNLIQFIIEHPEHAGIYNAVSPEPVTNEKLTKEIAKSIHRFVWPINVPKAALKLLLGQMSELVLNSNKASARKIANAGFDFKFDSIKKALDDIYRS